MSVDVAVSIGVKNLEHGLEATDKSSDLEACHLPAVYSWPSCSIGQLCPNILAMGLTTRLSNSKPS